MMELIKVEQSNGELLVSGRDLHEALEIGTRYDKWIGRMIEYGFEENIDYIAIAQKRPTAQGNMTNYTDHVLKIDMAKEIAMIQRNEKGKQVRKYFLECERKLKEVDRPSYMIDDPIKRAKKWIEEQEEKVRLQIELDESKQWYSIKRVASMNNISWKNLSWQKLKRESAVQDKRIMKIFDANYGTVNTYHKDVWEVVYPELRLE